MSDSLFLTKVNHLYTPTKAIMNLKSKLPTSIFVTIEVKRNVSRCINHDFYHFERVSITGRGSSTLEVLKYYSLFTFCNVRLLLLSIHFKSDYSLTNFFFVSRSICTTQLVYEDRCVRDL